MEQVFEQAVQEQINQYLGEGFQEFSITDSEITDTASPALEIPLTPGEIVDLSVTNENLRPEQTVESVETVILPETSRKLLAYEPELDAMEVLRNEQLAQVNPLKAAQEQIQLEKRIEFNQEVYIMERNRAPIHQPRIYNLKYNEDTGEVDMYPEGEKRTLVDLISKGIEHRKGKGLPEDEEREAAEKDGAIELRTLANEAVGSKRFSFSPPSGSYKNNFFDGFELCEDDLGNRFIRMQRFATSLTPEDYRNIIPVLTDAEVVYDHVPTPAELLSHPVAIPFGKFETLRDVRDAIHKEGNLDYTDAETIDEAIDGGDPQHNGRFYMKRYITTLFSDPTNSQAYKAAFRAMINFTDAKIYFLKHGQYQDMEMEQIFTMPSFNASYALENRPAMLIASDCGEGFGAENVSGSMFESSGLMNASDIINWSSFSVADFAKDRDWMGPLKFNCPACGYENTRPYERTIKLCENPGYCKKRSAVWCGVVEEPEDETSASDGALVEEKFGNRSMTLKDAVKEALSRWLEKGKQNGEQEEKAETKAVLVAAAMN